MKILNNKLITTALATALALTPFTGLAHDEATRNQTDHDTPAKRLEEGKGDEARRKPIKHLEEGKGDEARGNPTDHGRPLDPGRPDGAGRPIRR